MIDIQRLAVIGAGTMGRQIALQCARYGFPLALHDVAEGVLRDAEAWQRQIAADWVAAGALSEADAAGIFDHIRYESDLPGALREADLAIEATPERIALKRQVFKPRWIGSCPRAPSSPPTVRPSA